MENGYSKSQVRPSKTSTAECEWSREEPNPIKRLMLAVTFSFIITTACSLAPRFSDNDGGDLKSRQIKSSYGWAACGVCSEIRVSITKRNTRDPSCRAFNDINSRALLAQSHSPDAQVQFGFIQPHLWEIVMGGCSSKQTRGQLNVRASWAGCQ